MSDIAEERERRRLETELVACGDRIRSLYGMIVLAEEERWRLIEQGLEMIPPLRKAHMARLLKISEGRIRQIIINKEGKPKK